MDDLDNFMAPEALARVLGVTVQALAQRRYRREGPPYIKVGRRIFYDRATVLAWIRSHEERGR